MGMPVYATKQDLTKGGWIDAEEMPSSATADLAAASRLVRRLTLTAIYETDSDGAPTEPRVRDGLRDAVCAQVAWWEQTGDRTGAASIYAETRVGGVSLRRSAAGAEPGSARVAPELADILTDAGLLGHPITRR